MFSLAAYSNILQQITFKHPYYVFDICYSSSSVRHSPSSSSGESPSTTGKVDSEEGGEGMATDVGGVMEVMQETVRQLQHQVHCLRAENAFLQRAVDRCSLATSESDKASVGSASVSGAYPLAVNPLRTSRLIRGKAKAYFILSSIRHKIVSIFSPFIYIMNKCVKME